MNDKTIINKKFLNGKEAAEYLEIGYNKFYFLINQGLIPQFKPTPNSRAMYLVSDLDEFIRKNRRHPKVSKVYQDPIGKKRHLKINL